LSAASFFSRSDWSLLGHFFLPDLGATQEFGISSHCEAVRSVRQGGRQITGLQVWALLPIPMFSPVLDMIVRRQVRDRSLARPASALCSPWDRKEPIRDACAVLDPFCQTAAIRMIGIASSNGNLPLSPLRIMAGNADAPCAIP